MTDAAYQKHSDTSREAAETLHSHGGQMLKVLEYIKAAGKDGRTGDEIAAHFNIDTGTASARLSDLMNNVKCQKILGLSSAAITKTPMRRKTRSGKTAVVHIAGGWADLVTEPAKTPLEAHKEKLSRSGHGHVVPRLDGTKDGCGGPRPGGCKICNAEKQYLEMMESRNG